MFQSIKNTEYPFITPSADFSGVVESYKTTSSCTLYIQIHAFVKVSIISPCICSFFH